MLTVDVPVDHVLTLSTKKGQMKGSYDSPPSQPFPLPYEDDFESESTPQPQKRLLLLFHLFYASFN